MSIRLKILLSIVLAVVITVLFVVMVSLSDTRTLTSASDDKFVMDANTTIQAYMKDLESSIERAALMVANNPDIAPSLAEFLKTGNRQKLIDATMEIAKYSDADFYTITDMNGKVMMRSHQPEKFGDSNADLDHVKAAMAGKKLTAYESSKNNPIALRCGIPIMYEGKQIGVTSGGYNLGVDKFVDKMKIYSGAEVTMFLGDTRVATTVFNDKGERNVGTKANENVAKQVLAGNDYTGYAEVAGKKMRTYYAPIRHADGEVFGMTFVGIDVSNTEKQVRKTITSMVIIVLIFCAVAVFIGLYIANGIAKPLNRVVNMFNEFKMGHISGRLKINRKDEIGTMAQAMDEFAENLQKEVIGTFKQISNGDLSASIVSRGPLDEINPVIRETVESLRALIIDDGGRVLQSAAEKDMSHRLRGEYKGEFARMKDNINSVMQSLDDALRHVSESVHQVSNASGEISQGSQSLAEGSNEQASSLEEVSSSLEEMSSMTKQNADNSNQAKLLVGEAGAAVNEADEAMKRMAAAITEIKTSSDNTAKILKTIDEIAFQTNLLALNAAVEAARAGEAGKGFAVVAEEVRNLAMRSAEASKNTAAMIEESVRNSENGVKITEDVARALDKTVDRAGKVSDLIAEIAAASNEQALGIEQVNTAVAQMNQVTQRNAANSEESASAAEELSAQASELSNMVAAFKLSGGGANKFALTHYERSGK